MTDLVAAVLDDRVLVRPGPEGSTLPVETDGEGYPTLEQLARAVGATSVLPLAPATRTSVDPRLTLHLVEPAGTAAEHWLGLGDLHLLAHPAPVAQAVRTGMAERTGTLPWPPQRPDWYAPGWRTAVEAFVDETLAGLGRRRAGAARVLALWSLSAVVEVPVADPSARSVFLKATCDHFRAEPVVTELLGRVLPGRVPEVLAVDARRGWMLMSAFTDHEGAPRLDTTPETAPDAARALAELQVALVERTAELLGAGAVDRTRDPTVAAFHRLVVDSLELPLLTADERAELPQLVPWVEQRIDALAATGMPATVGHGDLHTGNYVRSDRGVVLFDWTDAALTFPSLDAAMLARSAGDEHADAVWAAYADPWRSSWPDADVRRARELAPVVNLAYQAISYEAIHRAQEPRTRWEMGGVVAANLRRLLECRQRDPLRP